MKNQKNPKLALMTHPLFYWHDTGSGAGMLPVGPGIQPYPHIESPESKQRVETLLAADGLLEACLQLTPKPASDASITAVHTPEHLARLERLAALGGGEAGVSAPVGFHSAKAARLAAGAAVQAVDTVIDTPVTRAYALVRPPGHHASANQAMAFCLLNNIAVGVRHAQLRGLKRIAVVDWDVHHGNGTEAIFEEDPEVLTISLHQDGLFPPGLGGKQDRGKGSGLGANLNIPLPAGSGHGCYLAAMERLVVPALAIFKPDCIMIAAGFDAGAFDPMGRQMLHGESFRLMTAALIQQADTLCEGRLIALHEGGYNPWHTPFLVRAMVTELMGLPPLHDPFYEQLAHLPGQRLSSDQQVALDRLETYLTERMLKPLASLEA